MHYLHSYKETNCRHLNKRFSKTNFEDLTYKLGLLDIFLQFEGECREYYLELSVLSFSFINILFLKFKIVGD